MEDIPSPGIGRIISPLELSFRTLAGERPSETREVREGCELKSLRM